ncbi:alpha-ketoacid dehydrogenase subunit beta [Salinibacterium sp. ZJ450]|uniref:alpha-ketoacid dehydrogenase subunit beta n=1 Tax=Salinibacterium sp. ZJ450 TaxID=2708338 RepID=UPI001CD23614|nr:transketolase C-terminal domain-containing protein [Salinibacterium sp. ZJ450]
MMANQNLTTWRSLNLALHDAFSEDPRLLIMGEDITTWGTGGGIYGVTRKLASSFGRSRVRDTPISEEVILAAGVGAAMTGTPTIVEIMYSDFTLLGLDALINQAAKARYMFGGQFKVPLVVRTNGGSGIGKAAQHSQSLETLFAHIPGLEVAVPATPDDAYGLLRSAIASPNPTIFLEHKDLYFDKGPVSGAAIPFGVARIARPGQHVTLVATQRALRWCHEAANELSAQGIEAEIVDPRTLHPLDFEAVRRSIQKTRNLVVVHEAVQDFGWGAEIIARAATECWQHLDNAPARLGAARTPVPYSAALEAAIVPQVHEIVETVQRMRAINIDAELTARN